MDFDFFELTQALECSFSERVALRPVALCDAWPLFVATRNPQFNRHLLWPQPDREEQMLKRVRMIMEASRRGRLTALSAVTRKTGEFVALFRFQPHATLPDTIEMGVWMHDKYWHGRYSLELGRLCVSAAFTLSDRVQLLLGASAPDNRGSNRLMQSVGMTPGTMVQRDTEMGYQALLCEYTITRAQWAARHATGFSLYGDDGIVAKTPVRAVPPRVPVAEGLALGLGLTLAVQ
ncbi:MAG TPA: GNAT family N-acetyltransferase [Burkholderiaceae bacterium]|nr:GNAT family N-acetyltransferase [Burkholderiaceae bacterium]